MFNGGAEGVADEFMENPPVEGAEGGTAAGVEGVAPKEKEAAGAEGVVVDGCAGVVFRLLFVSPDDVAFSSLSFVVSVSSLSISIVLIVPLPPQFLPPPLFVEIDSLVNDLR